MTMNRLAARRIVLLGIGHTHAHIVRMWGRQPIHDAELVCISDSSIATYSGLLPAVLNGQCPESAMQIDLTRLCTSVGATLIMDEVVGLNLQRRVLTFRERPELPFDVLSIGIGSLPVTDGVDFSKPETIVQLKPMRSLLLRLQNRLKIRLAERAAATTPVIPENPFHVVVAGAGAAGVEIACCLGTFLERQGIHFFRITLVSTTDEILPGVSTGLRRRVQRHLTKHQQRFSVICSSRILRAESSAVHLHDGRILNCDLIVWATGAKAPPILTRLGLPVDEQGFLLTDSTLRSTSRQPVFAVGDCGTIAEHKLPKAGVFAVRQGPVLWENLNRLLQSQPLQHYVPQRSFMKILNLGDGTAAGEWRGLSFSGNWVMRLKNRIDHGFMRMYQQAMPTVMADHEQCRGCGCKLGSNVLESALSKLQRLPASHLNVGVAHKPPDDAALIRLPSGGRVMASTDFFTPPVRDLWLSGRIAAQHAMTDLYAMGAKATGALATIVLPEGSPESQQQALTEILHGMQHELHMAAADLVGGHTIVGPRLELGLTVIGEPFGTQLLQKQNLKPGDVLYLTKPLGTGVLLAAGMKAQSTAAYYDRMLESLLESQEAAARMAIECGLSAGTDVTGFGLLGHLTEMLKASGCNATLNLAAIPVLPGAREAVTSGIQSSLGPDNRRITVQISAVSDHELHVCPVINRSQVNSVSTAQPFSTTIQKKYHSILELLYDPQTCGGLLLAAPAHIQLPFTAHAIGKVLPPKP